MITEYVVLIETSDRVWGKQSRLSLQSLVGGQLSRDRAMFAID